MVNIQTGNMLDVVVEGKSIALKQRDSDHRKYQTIWLPAPEGLRDVLAAEIKRLNPAESPVTADEAERQARRILMLIHNPKMHGPDYAAVENAIAAALRKRPVEQEPLPVEFVCIAPEEQIRVITHINCCYRCQETLGVRLNRDIDAARTEPEE